MLLSWTRDRCLTERSGILFGDMTLQHREFPIITAGLQQLFMRSNGTDRPVLQNDDAICLTECTQPI